MKDALSFLAFCFLTSLLPATVSSQSKLSAESTPSSDRSTTRILNAVRGGSVNINNLWLKVRCDGILGYDSLTANGLSYPFQYGNLLYADDFIWTGKVRDGILPELRSGGGIYRTGVRPGSIMAKGVAEEPGSEAARVFRFRPDYLNADLTFDVAASKSKEPSSVNSDDLVALRTSYEKDLAEWPWQKGAPFIDKNHNGIMDGDEKPGIQRASQVAWFAYNDLDEATCRSISGSPSIGLEVQVTLWAYKGIPNLDDVIFKRYRLFYKGTSSSVPQSRIDSMYLMQWADPDVGLATNDLGGCDSALGLAFVFNATIPDPQFSHLGADLALGYVMLQGPLVPGLPNDRGLSDFQYLGGKKNLGMTSFLLNATGDPIAEPPYGAWSYWYWNAARGFAVFERNSESFTPWKDALGNVTTFTYSGDPVTKSGWIDGLGILSGNCISATQGDRRFMMSTGPFTMALGEAQEVVLAIVASQASTGIENVTRLKNRAKYLLEIYPNLEQYVAGFVTSVGDALARPTEFALEQNYPNPFNPSTSIRFSIPDAKPVRLAIFDMLGQEIRILLDGVLPPGEHAAVWDGRDRLGDLVPSGIYFSRLTQGKRHETRKLVLVR